MVYSLSLLRISDDHRPQPRIFGKDLPVAALTDTCSHMPGVFKHKKRRLVMGHMRPCTQVQIFSLRRLIRHLTGVRNRSNPGEPDGRIPVVSVIRKRYPVINHLFIIICRKQFGHPPMSIFFKLGAPLSVPRRHLLIQIGRASCRERV